MLTKFYKTKPKTNQHVHLVNIVLLLIIINVCQP